MKRNIYEIFIFTLILFILSGLPYIFTLQITPKHILTQKKTSSKTNQTLLPTLTTNASSTPTKKISPTSKKTTPLSKLQTASSTPISQATLSSDEINDRARAAIVNILCYSTAAGPLSPITGSGVIINENGLILTNAHIAQYFLLKDFNNQKDFLTCIIRTGNPAYPSYTAELVYISPLWVAEHKTDITSESPKGTGEYDYAFLRITGKVDRSSLPNTFPFISPNLIEYTEVGTPAVLVSYPAGFLGGQTIIQNLYQSSAVSTVSDRYTFGDSTVDLISLGGSIVAQKGSSGGAVVDSKGSLIGIISTTSDGNTTMARDLHAITPAYINRDLIKEAKETLNSLALKSASFAQTFNAEVAPGLTKTLTDVILKK